MFFFACAQVCGSPPVDPKTFSAKMSSFVQFAMKSKGNSLSIALTEMKVEWNDDCGNDGSKTEVNEEAKQKEIVSMKPNEHKLNSWNSFFFLFFSLKWNWKRKMRKREIVVSSRQCQKMDNKQIMNMNMFCVVAGARKKYIEEIRKSNWKKATQ